MPWIMEASSSPTNLPANFANTNLMIALLIVVIPLSLGQVNVRKWCRRFDACRLPFALYPRVRSTSFNPRGGGGEGKRKCRHPSTYIRFKFRKFKPATVDIDDLLAFLFTVLLGIIRIRTSHYRGRVCSLIEHVR